MDRFLIMLSDIREKGPKSSVTMSHFKKVSFQKGLICIANTNKNMITTNYIFIPPLTQICREYLAF